MLNILCSDLSIQQLSNFFAVAPKVPLLPPAGDPAWLQVAANPIVAPWRAVIRERALAELTQPLPIRTDDLYATDVVPAGLSEITTLPNITFNDTSTPTAVVNASQATATAGATTCDFAVTYTDQYQVNAATLGDGNLVVTLPSGTQEAATLVSQNLGNAANVQATYTTVRFRFSPEANDN